VLRTESTFGVVAEPNSCLLGVGKVTSNGSARIRKVVSIMSEASARIIPPIGRRVLVGLITLGVGLWMIYITILPAITLGSDSAAFAGGVWRNENKTQMPSDVRPIDVRPAREKHRLSVVLGGAFLVLCSVFCVVLPNAYRGIVSTCVVVLIGLIVMKVVLLVWGIAQFGTTWALQDKMIVFAWAFAEDVPGVIYVAGVGWHLSCLRRRAISACK